MVEPLMPPSGCATVVKAGGAEQRDRPDRDRPGVPPHEAADNDRGHGRVDEEGWPSATKDAAELAARVGVAVAGDRRLRASAHNAVCQGIDQLILAAEMPVDRGGIDAKPVT